MIEEGFIFVTQQRLINSKCTLFTMVNRSPPQHLNQHFQINNGLSKLVAINRPKWFSYKQLKTEECCAKASD